MILLWSKRNQEPGLIQSNSLGALDLLVDPPFFAVLEHTVIHFIDSGKFFSWYRLR